MQIETFKGDAVIVTGGATGEKPTRTDIQDVKSAVSIPVFVGSGITTENVKDYIDVIDGAIVGSEFKEGGKRQNPVSFERTKAFMNKVRSYRSMQHLDHKGLFSRISVAPFCFDSEEILHAGFHLPTNHGASLFRFFRRGHTFHSPGMV